MQPISLTPIRPRRSRRGALLLCAGLLATAPLAAAPLADDDSAAETVQVAGVTTTHLPLLNRDLLLSVVALLAVLVGMERLAAWRLGVNRRREMLDVSSALLRSAGGGSTMPEISPVAWRTVLPGSRSPRTISP